MYDYLTGGGDVDINISWRLVIFAKWFKSIVR